MAGTRGNRGGRPPKATSLHILDGTFRKDRHAKRKDLLPTSDGRLPPPPEDMDPAARSAWEELAKPLTRRIFSPEDVVSFHAFAAMWATWRVVSTHVLRNGVACEVGEKDGRITRKTSPEASMWSDLNGKLLHYFGRFGMTPVDRARLRDTGVDSAKKENPDDEFTAKQA